jgi:hypothetical protein
MTNNSVQQQVYRCKICGQELDEYHNDDLFLAMMITLHMSTNDSHHKNIIKKMFGKSERVVMSQTPIRDKDPMMDHFELVVKSSNNNDGGKKRGRR